MSHQIADDGVFRRHRGPVTSVVRIPGLQAALSCGYDGAVAYVDLDRRSFSLLGYHDHLVNQVTVNDDGTKAASSSSDYTISIWDIINHRRQRVLRGHSDDVEAFAFIDDATGVSVSRDSRIILWQLDTGAIIRVIEGHEKDVLSVAYDDGCIYTSGDDTTLRKWDAETGHLLHMWGPFDCETDTCAIDPANRRVVLGCDDGAIRVFDVDSGLPITEIKAHASGIKRVSVSPATGDVLSAAYDQRMLVWDSDTYSLKTTLNRQASAWERSFSWASDEMILGGTFDGTVLVWDAGSGECVDEIGRTNSGNSCLNDIAANSAGDFVTVADDGVVRRGRVTGREGQWTSEVHASSGRVLSNAVTMDPLSGLVISGTHDQKLQSYLDTGAGLENSAELPLNDGPVNCVRVANQPGYERQIFAACYSGAIVRADYAGQVLGRFTAHDGAAKALRLAPHVPVGVSCGADGSVNSWSFDGVMGSAFKGHTAIVNDLDLEPDGTRLVTVGRDFSLRIFSFEDGRLLDAIPVGHHSPKSVCFFDADTIIVGTYWGELIRVQPSTGSVRKRQLAANGISSLAKSGESVIAASYSGTVYVVRPGDLVTENTMETMTQRLEPSTLLAPAAP
jgi:toxoflavin biosynthesis protein ToxC